ncbi:MAG TPA: thiol reductant ABC exporter subunit CydC, partial [Acidimicrobiales bacterium]|nr:thiol reductant ABC exporter subunit CydC [Acidimicrobiales bacterium]
QQAPFWRTVQLVRPVGGRLGATTFLSAASAGSGVALLATSAWLISRAAQHPSVVVLGVAIVGVQFFSLSRALFRYKERLVGHDAALRVLADLRARVYEQLEVLAPAGLPAFRRGDLLARIVGDVDSVQDLMLRVLSPFGVVFVVAVPTVGFIWYFLPSAALVLGVALLAGALLVPWFTLSLARRRESRQAGARGQLSTHVVDLIEGAPELVAFGAIDAQLARVSTADAELTRIASATARTAGVGSGLITLLTGLAVWGILLVSVPAVHSGRLQGPLLAVVALIPLAAFEMVSVLPGAAQWLARVRESAARIFEVFDARPVVVDPAAPAPLAPAPHSVRVRGLRVRHSPFEPWVLDGVDLDLCPGRRIGVVGASGAGKSSLAAVLQRFLPYESGSVTLDGAELAAMAGEDVRRVVGLAAQDTHIFQTTLRENVLLARRSATEVDVRQALERAKLSDWVKELPAGLDTSVGQHGAGMSGGQRQRLGIARAILAGFPILVLDEPGEHLDVATADALTADLVELTEGQTTVMITHRLAGLETMDEILVLDAGRVVERGTHSQLIAANGRYARQWQRECLTSTERGPSC